MPGRHVPQRDVEVDDVVVCSGLTKDYGRANGVFDLDLTIRRGEVFVKRRIGYLPVRTATSRRFT